MSPTSGRLLRNRQLIVLKTASQENRFRLSIFKVTGSSRGKPQERRIQITTTYQRGLTENPKYQDVVLGYDSERDILVGVDPRRLAHGGATGNASSFFDKEGLRWEKDDEILVRPRTTKLFANGLEYHGFFRPGCIAEYLLNLNEIHSGVYRGSVTYNEISDLSDPSLSILAENASGKILVLCGPTISSTYLEVTSELVEAYENGNSEELSKAKLSPEELAVIKRRCEENGQLGEEFALNFERQRLRKAGRNDLAEKLLWISQESAGEGYDILSYDTNGEERWIEVKSTSGISMIVEISKNEWNTAVQAGCKYFIYRVTCVRTRPKIQICADPAGLESQGVISKTPSGWRLNLEI